MTFRSKKHLLLPLLTLGLALAVSAPALAQDHPYPGANTTSATLQINFGTSPHWTGVRGTRVQQIRERERPDYDMFRYGGRYYVYQNSHWYSSRSGHGQFMLIEDRAVPREFSKVPRSDWRSYPTGWAEQGGPRSKGHDPHHS